MTIRKSPKQQGKEIIKASCQALESAWQELIAKRRKRLLGIQKLATVNPPINNLQKQDLVCVPEMWDHLQFPLSSNFTLSKENPQSNQLPPNTFPQYESVMFFHPIEALKSDNFNPTRPHENS